jgi:hypothetical protein
VSAGLVSPEASPLGVWTSSLCSHGLPSAAVCAHVSFF